MTHANLVYVQVPAEISSGGKRRRSEKQAAPRFIPDIEKNTVLKSHVDVRCITLNADCLGLFLKVGVVSEITSALHEAFPRHVFAAPAEAGRGFAGVSAGAESLADKAEFKLREKRWKGRTPELLRWRTVMRKALRRMMMMRKARIRVR
jgi:hypothetical protein